MRFGRLALRALVGAPGLGESAGGRKYAPVLSEFQASLKYQPLNSYLTFRCEPWTLTTRFNLNLCVLPAGAAKKLQQDLRSCAPLCDLQSNSFLIVPAGLCAITIVICVPTPKGLRRAESSLGPLRLCVLLPL